MSSSPLQFDAEDDHLTNYQQLNQRYHANEAFRTLQCEPGQSLTPSDTFTPTTLPPSLTEQDIEDEVSDIDPLFQADSYLFRSYDRPQDTMADDSRAGNEAPQVSSQGATDGHEQEKPVDKSTPNTRSKANTPANQPQIGQKETDVADPDLTTNSLKPKRQRSEGADKKFAPRRQKANIYGFILSHVKAFIGDTKSSTRKPSTGSSLCHFENSELFTLSILVHNTYNAWITQGVRLTASQKKVCDKLIDLYDGFAAWKSEERPIKNSEEKKTHWKWVVSVNLLDTDVPEEIETQANKVISVFSSSNYIESEEEFTTPKGRKKSQTKSPSQSLLNRNPRTPKSSLKREAEVIDLDEPIDVKPARKKTKTQKQGLKDKIMSRVDKEFAKFRAALATEIEEILEEV